MTDLITLREREVLQAWKEAGGDSRIAGTKLGMKPGAVAVAVSRIRKKRRAIFKALNVLAPYTECLKPRRITIWDEMAAE